MDGRINREYSSLVLASWSLLVLKELERVFPNSNIGLGCDYNFKVTVDWNCETMKAEVLIAVPVLNERGGVDEWVPVRQETDGTSPAYLSVLSDETIATISLILG